MDTLKLQKEWQAAKLAETEAVKKRREIEDQLIAHYGVTGVDEGTATHDNFKITTRMTRKVDGDKLQEIAMENGTSDQLSVLFRWSPSINMAVWKASSETITKPLEAAITTKPSRPSFKLEIKD